MSFGDKLQLSVSFSVAFQFSENMKGLACFSLLAVFFSGSELYLKDVLHSVLFTTIELSISFIKYFSALHGRPQREEPEAQSGCDPDFGWHDGADGSGKCYRLVKASDFT